MSYTIKYTGPRNEKFARAYGDALRFNTQGTVILGKEFRKLWHNAATLKEQKQAVNLAHLAGEFIGVRGFPIRAVMRHALTQAQWRHL